jgi:hypothetical protein
MASATIAAWATTWGELTTRSAPRLRTRSLGQESIFESSLMPSPLGRGGSFDPCNNSIVYFFAFLALFQVYFWPILFGPFAIAIAVYRVVRHRSHANRGLVVAIVALGATALGLWFGASGLGLVCLIATGGALWWTVMKWRSWSSATHMIRRTAERDARQKHGGDDGYRGAP